MRLWNKETKEEKSRREARERANRKSSEILNGLAKDLNITPKPMTNGERTAMLEGLLEESKQGRKRMEALKERMDNEN